MARFTSLEFMEALGLGYMDYNGAKILLRLLASRGIAKEVDKISLSGKGRPQVVYEIPDEITISVKPPESTPTHEKSRMSCVPKRKKKVGASVKDVAEAVSPIKVADIIAAAVENHVPEVEEPVAAHAMDSSDKQYEYDDGWEDE